MTNVGEGEMFCIERRHDAKQMEDCLQQQAQAAFDVAERMEMGGEKSDR